MLYNLVEQKLKNRDGKSAPGSSWKMAELEHKAKKQVSQINLYTKTHPPQFPGCPLA